MRTLMLFLLAATTCAGQAVICSGKAKECPRKQDAQQIVSKLPAPPDWSVILVSSHSLWNQFCESKCEIPAFTVLSSRRTYLDIEKIWSKSGESGIKAYLSHELGHILSGSAKEKDADEMAKSFH